MKRQIVAAGFALMAMANPVLSDGMRPKPRPAMVSNEAGAESQPVQTIPAASAQRPDMRPIGPLSLQKTAPMAAPSRDPTKGAVTNLPLPRFVSLKTGEGNARRGPGLTHRIDWVFTRTGMPLKITAEYEHWRRVEDSEGVGGWVHYALLSGVRSVMVTSAMATFYARADLASQVAFQAEEGVVARVIECKAGWCRVAVDGQKGWVQVSDLWGVAADEVIN
ncbi:MAG: SH3 domain-containing protein [Paracoccaceae bacterium]